MPKRSSKYSKRKSASEPPLVDTGRKTSIANDFETLNAASQKLNIPSAGTTEKKERKKSVWAPAATATTFADVPVFTICPYCNQKVVTKTQFRRGRKNWYCFYWLPHFLDIFKDVIHTCPKCNTQIAIYNRFFFFKRDSAEEAPEQEAV